MRSMTGFGRAETTLDGLDLVVEARSVNHRFSEARISWPRALGLPPGFGEDVAKRALGRGRVEIVGRLSRASQEGSVDALIQRIRPLLAIRDRLDPGGQIPWALASMLPEHDQESSPAADEATQAAATRALEAALASLDETRAREGARIETELQRLAEEIRAELAEARSEAAEFADRARARLRARVDALLEGRDATFDPGRLEVEIALLADRGDVTEELARLDAHAAELESLFERDEPVGRRIDFLLQEMHREVNTLGSKSADGKLSRVVLDLKASLEKLREQAQNVL